MAYRSTSLVRSLSSPFASNRTVDLFFYSTEDTQGEIEAAGYFRDPRLRPGDLVIVSYTQGTQLPQTRLYNVAAVAGGIANLVNAKPDTLVLSGNTGTTSIPAGATRYATHGLVNTSQSLVYVPAGRRGRFRNLRVITPGAPGAGESYTFTLQKLFSDTALTCAIGPGGNEAADLAKSVLFEANERWSIKVASSAGAAALSNILYSMLFDAID